MLDLDVVIIRLDREPRNEAWAEYCAQIPTGRFLRLQVRIASGEDRPLGIVLLVIRGNSQRLTIQKDLARRMVARVAKIVELEVVAGCAAEQLAYRRRTEALREA